MRDPGRPRGGTAPIRQGESNVCSRSPTAPRRGERDAPAQDALDSLLRCGWQHPDLGKQRRERGDLGILLGEDVGKARSVLTSVDSFASTASATAQTSRGRSLVTAPDIARIGAATNADVEVTASGSPTPMVRSSTEITPSTRSCGSTTGTASSEFGTYPMRSATSPPRPRVV